MSAERKPTVIKTLLIIGSVTAEQYEHVRLEMIRYDVKPKVIRLDVKQLQADVMTWLRDDFGDESLDWYKPYVKQCGSTYAIVFENSDRRIEFELLTYALAQNDNVYLKVFVIDRNGRLEEVFGATSR